MKHLTSEELFTFFQNNLICESLTRKEVEVLADYLQGKTFKKGEVITDFGEVGDFLGFIIEGKVVFTAPDGVDEAEVGTQGVGSLIGEMSFFDRKPRQLRIKAKKEVKMLILTRCMYDRIKVEHPYIAVNIVENAIVSLDNLVRNMGQDITALEHYMHGVGKR